MFKVTWLNYGELDNTSTNFCMLVYDVSSHNICYETCNGIRHIVRCDFSSIFDELHRTVSSEEFQSEKPTEDGCDGDWYKFEYILDEEEVKYEGYIYGLEWHKKIVSLIESCAKSTLDDERKLLEHKCTDGEILSIIKQRQKLDEDFLDFWTDIVSNTLSVPDGFIKCDNCNSIVHNKYYKNRKYWGSVRLRGAFGDYEEEYDSGECPVCGQLNTELPCSYTDLQPEESVDFDENKLYSADELDGFLKKLISDEDRAKVSDCQFKVFENYPDDDSDNAYYYITVYRGSNEVGKIDMQYHSNTYWDLIDNEEKTTSDTPYYSYIMTLNEDSKEDIKNPFDDSKEDIKNPFDDSKFRCKKCGEVFCSCNKFFSRKRDKNV